MVSYTLWLDVVELDREVIGNDLLAEGEKLFKGAQAGTSLGHALELPGTAQVPFPSYLRSKLGIPEVVGHAGHGKALCCKSASTPTSHVCSPRIPLLCVLVSNALKGVTGIKRWPYLCTSAQSGTKKCADGGIPCPRGDPGDGNTTACFGMPAIWDPDQETLSLFIPAFMLCILRGTSLTRARKGVGYLCVAVLKAYPHIFGMT